MAGTEQDHLAQRFGLGPARSGEDWSPDAAAATIAHLPKSALFTLSAAAERHVHAMDLRGEARRKKRAGQKTKDGNFARFARGSYRDDVHARIVWAARTEYPFAERLLAYWSNHFTVSRRKPPLGYLSGPYEAEAIMPHIGGYFADMLKASAQHQGMLIYLDQVNSIGPNSKRGRKKGTGLNENLAREILELHTLGVNGGYTQADVTEFAKLMTGWTVDGMTGESRYMVAAAEPGPRKILGKTYAADGRSAKDFAQVLDDLAAHPSTAKHVATRLVTHFIADDPPADAIAAVENAFLQSGGHLPQVYRALLSLPQAREQPLHKARTDRDFLICGLRATGIDPDSNARTGRKKDQMPFSIGALALLRQAYWDALSPAGWPEQAEEWLSPAGLAGRLQLIPKLVQSSTAASPGDLMERALGSLASERTRKMVSVASNREEAMALILASPEFNRR